LHQNVSTTLELSVTEQHSAWSTPVSKATVPVTAVPARLMWKDASGATRFTSVLTREIHDDGVVVECESPVALPLYRLVHLQVEKTARESSALPRVLRDGRVLSAVWRVGPRRPSTGTPDGYALRFMVEPTLAETADARPARKAS
jgi:hypothetical protein